MDLFQEKVNSHLSQNINVLHTKSKQWLICHLKSLLHLFCILYIQVSEHGDQNK